MVPLEERGRIVGNTATPKFAQMVSWKYAQLPATKVEEDLGLNHARPTSRKLVQRLGKCVGEIALGKEFEWTYELPDLEEVVKHIAISRDGTTTAILGEGYRETMCSTISFYNGKGDRMHTIYSACAPEHGKANFDMVMDMEIGRVKEAYPDVAYLGLADGSKDNWTYLQRHTGFEILDFFHASEHLADVSAVMKNNQEAKKTWLEEACHDLKNKPKGAQQILRELKHYRKTLSGEVPEVLHQTITYFANNQHRMKYAHYQKQGYPIGSGVMEAACKVVVKHRLNGSGMRWNLEPVEHMLLLRGIICTSGRWEQFWKHIDKNGL